MDFQERYQFNPKTDLLGKGGFSKVYKANDTLLDRTVALKFFTGTISDKYQVLNEIKKVIRFEHPNLCKYYDVAVLSNVNVVGETERVEVGIMEYIDAGDFKTFTRKNPEHIDKLLIDVLKGLAYLHRHGIAHRDLKPQNILIKTDEFECVSKITDFGISKLIVSDDEDNKSTLLGTIEYMAPEQFNPRKYGINGRITTNLDLWSFGLLVYEAVCHESFFGSRSGGISAEQVMANILSEASLAKADTLPAKYREIVKRCLVKNAAERVQNALELIPLFEDKMSSMGIVQGAPEIKPRERMTEVARTINPELPVNDETQELNARQELLSDETEVIHLAPEMPAEETQVIEPIPDPQGSEKRSVEPLPDITEETQVIEQSPEITETQVIDVFSDSETADTEVIDSLPPPTEELTQVIEPVLEDSEEQKEKLKATVSPANVMEQPAGNKKKIVVKPLKKIILLSVAALLMILFIAYPFSHQSDKIPVTLPQDTTTHASRPFAEAPALVEIKGGTFMMGSAGADTNKVTDSGDFASANDLSMQPHEVFLSDFSLGKYEVTVEQFKKFIEETAYRTTAQKNGSSKIFVDGNWIDGENVDWQYDVQGILITLNTKDIPVVHVSWTDANAYCQWLSKKTNETFRLPTEAEWEFAAKGGGKSNHFSFSGGNTINEVAWYQKNSGDSIHTIGTKKANELGVYDMSGNALEWCNDWYDKDYYKRSSKENPRGPNSPGNDSARVLRGGAWAFDKNYCTTIYRSFRFKADASGGSIGFRICKVKTKS